MPVTGSLRIYPHTAICVCVCLCKGRRGRSWLCMCLGTKFAATNESQTRVSTHFTHIASLWWWEYSASAKGEALTCPWTSFSGLRTRKPVSLLKSQRSATNFPLLYLAKISELVILLMRRVCSRWLTFQKQVQWFIRAKTSEGEVGRMRCNGKVSRGAKRSHGDVI